MQLVLFVFHCEAIVEVEKCSSIDVDLSEQMEHAFSNCNLRTGYA